MPRIVTGLLMLLLASPGVAAGWGSNGGSEPSTLYDLQHGMWADPPGGATNRVYLNVVSTTGGPAAGSGLVNPNVAALETRIETFGLRHHEAFFGVWRDCDGDGYVGRALLAAREYDAKLLLDDSDCPATTGLHNEWVPGAHNYNGWVTELIPIANVHDARDARVHVDEQARVYGYLARPHEAFGEPDWELAFVHVPRGGPLQPGAGGADGFAGAGNAGSRWVSTAPDLKPLPRTVRLDPMQPAPSASFDEPEWLTFYAEIGWTTRARGHVTPGGLRDVDCYDGEIAHGTGLGVGAPFYGERPCSLG